MAHTGEGINTMTQALCAEDGSLPQGLTVQNTYMELHDGSRNVTVVVTNSTKGEDPSGKGSHSYAGTRAPYTDHCNGGSRGGTRPPNAKVNCETKVGEIVQGAGFEWTGILASELADSAQSSLG